MLATILFRIFCIPVSFQKLKKIPIYETIILLVSLYGCDIGSLALREDHRLKVFENRVLRRTFDPMKKCQEAGEDYIMRSFITCTLHQMLLG
jgi:hypothetical protein